ncbi:MAG: hypothetical protein IPK99_14110 [Flavobacteriales bacterium]|nr:hypothetical protein [Flavobacteriales bacterium]
MNDRRTAKALRPSWFPLFLLLCAVGAAEGTFAQSYSWAWAQGINGADDEEVADLVTDNGTGAVYAVGYTKSNSVISTTLGTVLGNQDAFLVKYSAAGAVVWGFTPSGAGESQATGVALDAAGNIYITGWFKNTIDLHGLSALGAGILISSGGEDWFVASYTPAGLLRWCTKLGGTSDERPVGVAVSSNGVYAFGTVKTNITTAFGSIPASLPNGKLNLVLAKYSLLGVGQSLISGGSGQDELANSVVADDDGVYVASRTKDNDLLWYGPTGLLLGNASAIDEWDQRVTAFTTAGTHAWTATVSELSDAIEQAPSKLAVGCGALYLTGLTHGPATFAGVGSVSSTTHDFFYLGRIERATGQFLWVNKGTSTGPHHTTGGTDLAVGQNGLVHVVGKFKDDLTMGTRSITSTNGKIQPFMASFRPTGSGASLEDLISSNDGSANAITADDQGNFILAGSYKANIACAALSLAGPNNPNGFLVKGSIPALAGVDISYWNAPATMCSNAAPLDLSTLVTPYQTGNAASVVTSSNVFSPTSILGGALGNYAQFNTTNGYVTVDLGVTVPVGGIISLLWHSNGGAATATTLVGTANPPTVAQSSFTTSSTTDVYTSIVLTTPARYIRITRSATSPAFEVDGIYYEYGNDLGGTWSGTGVTGNTFDPTGLSGPVSITYTVGTPPCTTASSNSITIEAAPVGGSITSSVSGMLCPGNNSGTLTLSGYTGTITGWMMSTDGFATSTAIANTTATLPFSNLLVTTQYRARVGVAGCGGAASGIHTVQVGDNTAPVITTCPPAQTIYVGATCKADPEPAAERCGHGQLLHFAHLEPIPRGQVFGEQGHPCGDGHRNRRSGKRDHLQRDHYGAQYRAADHGLPGERYAERRSGRVQRDLQFHPTHGHRQLRDGAERDQLCSRSPMWMASR